MDPGRNCTRRSIMWIFKNILLFLFWLWILRGFDCIVSISYMEILEVIVVWWCFAESWDTVSLRLKVKKKGTFLLFLFVLLEKKKRYGNETFRSLLVCGGYIPYLQRWCCIKYVRKMFKKISIRKFKQRPHMKSFNWTSFNVKVLTTA